MKRILLIIKLSLVALAITPSLFSQLPKFGKGPGGVGLFDTTSAVAAGQPFQVLWLRADKIDASKDENGDYNSSDFDQNKNLVRWEDQTGNQNHAIKCPSTVQYISGNEVAKGLDGPLYIANGSNNMPTLNFGDPSKNRAMIVEQRLDRIRIDGGSNGISIFMVVKRNEINATTGDFRFLIDKRNHTGDYTPNRSFGIMFDGGTANFMQTNTVIHNSLHSDPVTGSQIYVYSDTTAVFDNTTKTNLIASIYAPNIYPQERLISFTDGVFTKTTATSVFPLNASPAPLVISSSEKSNISEIVIYKEGINKAQDAIVNNCLGIKYNLTINSGIPVYGNRTVSGKFPAGYHYDAIGVGRVNTVDPYNHIHRVSYGGGLILDITDKNFGQYNFVYAAHDSAQTVTADSNGIWSRKYYIKPTYTGLSTDLYFVYDSVGLTVPSDYADYKLWATQDTTGVFTEIAASPTLVDSALKFTISNFKAGFYVIGKVAPADTITIGVDPLFTEDIKAQIFPNPVGDQLNIDLTGKGGKTTLTILSTKGDVIKTVQVNKFAGAVLETIDVADLKQGVYLLLVEQGGAKKVLRFVKI